MARAFERAGPHYCPRTEARAVKTPGANPLPTSPPASTAVELAQDLEGMQLEPMGMATPAARADASAATPGANSHADLLNRIEALEHQMTEREQVFRRLTRMLGV